MQERVESLRRRQQAAEQTATPPPQSAVPGPETPATGRLMPEFGEPPGENETITMNFNDVELETLVKFMSELTGKNFVIDPNLKGRITIISPEALRVDEAYHVFLSILEVHGLAAIPSGKVVKIVQAAEARSKGGETNSGTRIRADVDNLVTQLIPLENGQAAEFAKFLGPLVPKTGLLLPYPETNTLILIDTQTNINRILKIVRELDIPGAKEQINIFELRHADAAKLAAKLSQLFQPSKGSRLAKETLKIIPEERTNSLIVLASPQDAAEIEAMLERLDRPQVRKRGDIHIYSLQHAVAEDVAAVLGQIPGAGGEGSEGEQKAPVISKEVQIYPDKATNTLVVIADPEEFQLLEAVIQELDVPRTMVYVEALIVEVAVGRSLDLGVEWRVAEDFSTGGGVIAGSPGASAVDSLARGVLPDGLMMGVVGDAITLGNQVFPSFGQFIQAVRSDSQFNILSTPQILTLDNQEAVIEVGQNIPFVTQVVQQSQIGDRPIQTFEYRDVGVTLRVTPTINDNRFVRLLVEESVKSVINSTALGGTVLAPTTTFRNAKTTLAVKDGETVVIGGLIQNRLDRSKTDTPFLSSIPVLGWLFKGTSDRDEKINLMVFLSPHIVENPQEARALYQEKKKISDREVDMIFEKQKTEPLRRRGMNPEDNPYFGH